MDFLGQLIQASAWRPRGNLTLLVERAYAAMCAATQVGRDRVKMHAAQDEVRNSRWLRTASQAEARRYERK
jgi:hypothetical protein